MTTIKKSNKNEQLIKAVNSLRLDFPIVELAEKMEVDKGNVSAYLNNKKPVSKNFIKKFEDVFNISIGDFEAEQKEIPQNKQYETTKDPPNEMVTLLKDHVNDLKDTIEILKKGLHDRNEIIDILKAELENHRQYPINDQQREQTG